MPTSGEFCGQTRYKIGNRHCATEILFASTEVMHRLRSDSPLHIFIENTYQIRWKGVMLVGPFFTTQRTTLIEYLIIALERWEKLYVLAHVRVNVPIMLSLLWYSSVRDPWASKPRFWSLWSQTELFFTTRVENRTLPIIWVFLWNRSNTNHFLLIPLWITIPIWNEQTRGSDWKIKSKNN